MPRLVRSSPGPPAHRAATRSVRHRPRPSSVPSFRRIRYPAGRPRPESPLRRHLRARAGSWPSSTSASPSRRGPTVSRLPRPRSRRRHRPEPARAPWATPSWSWTPGSSPQCGILPGTGPSRTTSTCCSTRRCTRRPGRPRDPFRRCLPRHHALRLRGRQRSHAPSRRQKPLPPFRRLHRRARQHRTPRCLHPLTPPWSQPRRSRRQRPAHATPLGSGP